MLFVAVLSIASADAKTHVVNFGKWTTVQWVPGLGEEKPVAVKVRALLVDGQVREFVVGPPHEVTERTFVVRRMFRVNDSLPEDSSAARGQWQRGGWLLVDRMSGHISPIVLPEFDAFYSATSWYRDYAAYCGVSDDGKKVYAVVAQLNRRKPVLKKPLSNEGVSEEGLADSACPAPSWQRTPVRVSFQAAQTKQTFAIRGHVVDVVNEAEEAEEEGPK
jgi:hypothetical protein